MMVNKRQFTIGMQPPSSTQGTNDNVKTVSQALGMRLPEDIHAMTLIGRSFDDNGAVLLIKATVDRDRLTGMAKLSPQYKSTQYRGFELDALGENTVCWAFLSPDVIVVAQTPEDIRRQIDFVSQTTQPTESEASDVPLLHNAAQFQGASVFLYTTADGLQELQKQEQLSPILAPVKRFQACIGERDDDLVLRAVLDVDTDESARQVRGALEGIRALATLTASNGNNPQAQMVSDLASRATTSVTQNSVEVDWPVPLSTLENFVDTFLDHHRASRHRATTQAALSAPAE
jgi:hypothetical protein